jgi:hypothetical protein
MSLSTGTAVAMRVAEARLRIVRGRALCPVQVCSTSDAALRMRRSHVRVVLGALTALRSAHSGGAEGACRSEATVVVARSRRVPAVRRVITVAEAVLLVSKNVYHSLTSCAGRASLPLCVYRFPARRFRTPLSRHPSHLDPATRMPLASQSHSQLPAAQASAHERRPASSCPRPCVAAESLATTPSGSRLKSGIRTAAAI